jgi:hypothetical protein
MSEPGDKAVIEKVASEHGIFVGGYSWFCCGPHPGTTEPDDNHSHAQFAFSKAGSRAATRHLLRAILAAVSETREP